MPNAITVQEIFHAALEIDSAEERENFLDQSCFDSPELRTQVDDLLLAHGKAEDFLEQSPEMPTLAPNLSADTDLTNPLKQIKFQGCARIELNRILGVI